MKEKQKCRNNCNKRRSLGRNIAATFGISVKNIEVGNSMITKHWSITHIVHYIYEKDLERMEEELIRQINFLSPKYLILQLFLSLKQDLNDVFRTDFDLQDNFEIS